MVDLAGRAGGSVMVVGIPFFFFLSLVCWGVVSWVRMQEEGFSFGDRGERESW